MNFSSLSNRRSLGKLVRRPLALVPDGCTVPVLQTKMRGAKWIVGSSTHGCWLGSYEWEKRIDFEARVPPGAVVYDIGANVGFYTLLGAYLAGQSGTVYAFEPNPRNIRYLRSHISLNRLRNVEVFEVAISDRAGTCGFDCTDGPLQGRLDANGAQLQVQCETLDGLTSQSRFRAPTVIKIDVEGAEHSVLLGAERVLRESRPVLFVATHSAALHGTCCKLLESYGYDVRSDAANEDILAVPSR